MGLLSNKINRAELKAGDHIYSWRNDYVYAHHGIYIGGEQVMHFTRGADQEIGTGMFLDKIIFSSSPSPTHPSDNPCPHCVDNPRHNGVMLSSLDCFLCGGELYLFQYGVSPILFLVKPRGGTCTLASSDPAEDVLHRANFLLQNGFGDYHLFSNNCEDFAIYCKTGLLVKPSVGVGRSGQVASLAAAARAIVNMPLQLLTKTNFIGLAADGYIMYCVDRYFSDIGVRRGVVKVPVETHVAHPNLDEWSLATDIAKGE